MDKVKLPKNYKVYMPLIALFLLLLLLLPRSPKFNYDYKKGGTWMYETLVAKFPFPILKTEEQLYQEKAQARVKVYPYFKLDPEVALKNLNSLDEATTGKYAHLQQTIREKLSYIYNKGIYDTTSLDNTVELGNLANIASGHTMKEVPFSELYTLQEARNEIYKVFAGTVQASVHQQKLLQTQSLTDSTSAQAVARDTSFAASADSAKTSARIQAEQAIEQSLAELVKPNLIYDREKTLTAYLEAVEYISPTEGIMTAGQTIVEKGEVITEDVFKKLNSYRAEFESSMSYKGNRGFQWLGNGILSFLLILILFLSINYNNPLIFKQYNKYLYLLMIYSLACVVTILVEKYNPRYLYMLPFPLIALFLLAFFKKRVVWVVYINSLLPLLMFSHNGIQLFVIYLMAGAVTMYAFAYFNRGWLQFVTAIIVFFSMLATWLMFQLVNGIDQYIEWKTVLYLFLGSLFSVAGYPLIYLFEKIFRLVSNTKLVELTDTNQPLLRQLASKAPGTFQHCLQVMNLCDAVAREIDANVPLIRAGALYHDVGKMQNPQCFIENETVGVKYHEHLTPEESAHDIIKHVEDGIAIAKQYNLPEEVREFIVTHHGTTCAGYFYNKYLQEGGNPDNKDAFTYKGHKPETKEQVILMMCDTLEAASRTLKDYSEASIENLVENLFKSKISDGQLEDSDITLHELNVMKAKIKDYLHQIYHARVVYPKKPASVKE